MKKRILSFISAIAVLIAALPALALPASADPQAWDGTADTSWYDGSDGFTIYTAEELAGLMSLISSGNDFNGKTVKLGADIVLNTGDLSGWDETGTPSWREWFSRQQLFEFAGIFDGRGHTVSGLFINKTGSTDFVYGLFDTVNASGTIQNVNISNSYIRGAKYIGAIAGVNYGIISNCTNAGTVRGSVEVGGICGLNYGMITNCGNTGTVKAKENVGGVCGKSTDGGVISNSFNTAAITSVSVADGGATRTGGVCGYLLEGTINFCFNTGAVLATGLGTEENTYAYAGGVCGYCKAADGSSNISDCYNMGAVSCGVAAGKENYAGGVIGGISTFDQDLTVLNCYNAGAVFAGNSFVSCAGGVLGQNESQDSLILNNNYYLNTTATNGTGNPIDSGSAKAAEAMKDDADFVTVLGTMYARDIFGDNGGYPVLRWQYLPLDNDGYYMISNADQLKRMSTLINSYYAAYGDKKYKLTADIVLNPGDLSAWDGTSAQGWREWIPAGTSENQFRGIFDGKGHTVSGLFINSSGRTYNGLFGYAHADSTITNVGVINGYIKGGDSTGGVCGKTDANVTNSFNSCKIVGGNYAGGVCGRGSVANSYNTGEVSGAMSVGGVTGGDDVTSCHNTGAVSGTRDLVGGVTGVGNAESCHNTGAVSAAGSKVGGVSGDGNVLYSYNACTVKGEESVGGIVGQGGAVYTYNTGTVTANDPDEGDYIGGICGEVHLDVASSYNIGPVTGDDRVGGICGYANGDTVSGCYNSGLVSGDMEVGGICGSAIQDITNCISVGGFNKVDLFVGGICGAANQVSSISGCFYYGAEFGVGETTADTAGRAERLFKPSADCAGAPGNVIADGAKTLITALKATLGANFNIVVSPKSSSDTAVATVANGAITGVSEGAATITADVMIVQNGLTGTGFNDPSAARQSAEIEFVCNVAAEAPQSGYNYDVTIIPDETTVEPEGGDGNNGGPGKDAAAVIDGNKISVNVPAEQFKFLTLDGAEVPAQRYEVSADEDGNLLLTLSEELFDELESGAHEMAVYYENGVVAFPFEIAGETDSNPVTGVTLGFGALAAATAALFTSRKKK